MERKTLRLSLGTTDDIRNDPNQFGRHRHGMTPREIAANMIKRFSVTNIPAGGDLRVPVLPPVNNPQSISDVQLRIRDKRAGLFVTFGVIFKITDGEIYLVGFQGADNVTYELDARHEGKNIRGKLIDGSRRLAMNPSYIEAGGIGVNAYDKVYDEELEEDVQVPYRRTLVLDRYNTAQHLFYLHSYKPGRERNFVKVAKALVYMAQLLAEMTRFKDITEHVFRQWYDHVVPNPDPQQDPVINGTPLGELLEKQNEWGDISYKLQQDNPDFTRARELGIAKRKEGWMSPEEIERAARGPRGGGPRGARGGGPRGGARGGGPRQ